MRIKVRVLSTYPYFTLFEPSLASFRFGWSVWRRAHQAVAALRKYRPGDRVNLTVVEGGDKREVAVELGERS